MPSGKRKAQQREKDLSKVTKRCKTIAGVFGYVLNTSFFFLKEIETLPKKQNKHYNKHSFS